MLHFKLIGNRNRSRLANIGKIQFCYTIVSVKHLSSKYLSSISSNHQASVKQVYQATIKHLSSKYRCLVAAWYLLDRCLVVAWQMHHRCLLDRCLVHAWQTLCAAWQMLCAAWQMLGGNAWQSVVKYLTCRTKHLSSAWRKQLCRHLWRTIGILFWTETWVWLC